MVAIAEQFVETRVVTRNAIIDWFQGIRNLLGWRLRGYEDTLKQNQEEMLDDLRDRYRIDWYRLDVDSMSHRSAIITVYGEGDLR